MNKQQSVKFLMDFYEKLKGTPKEKGPTFQAAAEALVLTSDMDKRAVELVLDIYDIKPIKTQERVVVTSSDPCGRGPVIGNGRC